MELSKEQKKIARGIIEAGLQKEFAKGLSKADAILNEWKIKGTNHGEAYHSLYRHIAAFDKHIARRYDEMTGSKYLFIISAQLRDGIIAEEDLNEFNPEVRGAIKIIAGFKS
ncbi:MAG: hypothetical protein AB9834_18250 [Lentimicrobium sp.]